MVWHIIFTRPSLSAPKPAVVYALDIVTKTDGVHQRISVKVKSSPFYVQVRQMPNEVSSLGDVCKVVTTTGSDMQSIVITVGKSAVCHCRPECHQSFR